MTLCMWLVFVVLQSVLEEQRIEDSEKVENNQINKDLIKLNLRV